MDILTPIPGWLYLRWRWQHECLKDLCTRSQPWEKIPCLSLARAGETIRFRWAGYVCVCVCISWIMSISKSVTIDWKQRRLYPVLRIGWTSLVAQTVKRLPTMRKTWVWSLGREDPLEKEMATHFSTLAWRIPWMEEHSLELLNNFPREGGYP